MSVVDLRQYLMHDDIDAGNRLLDTDKHRNRIDCIARSLTRPCPHHLEAVTQAAHLHVLEQVQGCKFISSFFRWALAEQGGRIAAINRSQFKILEVPAVIQHRAAQLCLENLPVLSRYEQVCFDNSSNPSIVCLTCTHPLRIATIDLALSETGDQKLREFYSWAGVVAGNHIRDYLRKQRRDNERIRQPRQVDLEDQVSEVELLSSGKSAWDVVEDWEYVEQVEAIDRAFPHKQYGVIWRDAAAGTLKSNTAIALSISTSEISKRMKELGILLAERQGRIDAATSERLRKNIRRSPPRNRSDTDY